MLAKSKLLFFTIFIFLSSVTLEALELVGIEQGPNGYTAGHFQDVGPGGGWYFTTVFGPNGNPIYTSGDLVLELPPFGTVIIHFEFYHNNNKKAIENTKKIKTANLLKYNDSRIKYLGEDIGALMMIVTDTEGRILSKEFLDSNSGYLSNQIPTEERMLIINVINNYFSETIKIITK
ncbi:hypothetical protein OAQ99_00360 [Candidatus Kapabacteria bacterium]|nr:hypothetical protein [Candidatus Kapabacteria bacterium]